MGPGRREGVGRRRRKRHARRGGDVGGQGRAERTTNMARMVVTLDVSKLSGWLNADARCRVEGRHGAMWGEVRAEFRGGRT